MASFPTRFNLGNGYPDPEEKKRFLSMGARMMRRVGQKLKDEGVIEYFEASPNEGGPAVAGEVYGTFHLGGGAAVLLEIGHSSFHMGKRADGVFVMGQHRETHEEDARRHRPTKSRPRAHPSKITGSNMTMGERDISDETLEFFLRKCLKSHPCPAAKAASEAGELDKVTANPAGAAAKQRVL